MFPKIERQPGELSTEQKKELELKLEGVKQEEGRLYLLDGNLTSTVADIVALVSRLNAKRSSLTGPASVEA